MKALLIGEYREGKLLDSTYELLAFAGKLGAEAAMLLVGDAGHLDALDPPAPDGDVVHLMGEPTRILIPYHSFVKLDEVAMPPHFACFRREHSADGKFPYCRAYLISGVQNGFFDFFSDEVLAER